MFKTIIFILLFTLTANAQLTNPVKDSAIKFTDVTTNNFSTTKHGFVPKGTNLGYILKDDGNWVSATSVVSGTTLSGVTLSNAVINGASNTLTVVSSNITDGTIVNGDINASAAIAWSKMLDLTVSRLLVSNSSGDVSATAVTDTEAGYLSGVTSSIQTQLGTKLASNGVLDAGTVSGGTVSGSSITVNDNVFIVQDDATPTKKLQFQLSNLVGTRVVTWPNFAMTPAAVDQNQSWTGVPTFGSGFTASSTTTLNGPTTFASTVSGTGNASLSVVDGSSFSIAHGGGKRVQFNIDAATSSTTVVLATPAVSGTLATLGGSETFTSKTLTSPTINNATVSGATTVLGGAIDGLNAVVSDLRLNTPTIVNGLVSGSTITARDDLFLLYDLTASRRMAFELSGISGTVVLSPPSASSTLAAIDIAQTYTAIPNLNAGVTTSGTFTANSNAVFANGKGLDFSATINSSGTTVSEIFNDYESGTCDAWVSMTTTMNPGPGVSGTYSTRSCRYTKIGSWVNMDAILAWASVSGTGNMVIVGPPYSPTVSTACNFHSDGLTLPASSFLQGYIVAGTYPSIVLEAMPMGGASATSVAKDNSVAALRVQCSYHTSSGL